MLPLRASNTAIGMVALCFVMRPVGLGQSLCEITGMHYEIQGHPSEIKPNFPLVTWNHLDRRRRVLTLADKPFIKGINCLRCITGGKVHGIGKIKTLCIKI